MPQKQVWSKNNMEVDDVWDDTELVKMYEESIKEVYKQPKTQIVEKKFKAEDGKEYLWKVGGTCMAPFEDNGTVEYYAATIESIGGANQLEVGVTFIYYKNQAVVQMKDLWENPEAVAQALALETAGQEKQPQQSSRSCGNAHQLPSTSTGSQPFSMPPSVPLPAFAPPVPPGVIGMTPPSMEEAQSSMLMSWYMNGYHTGYYQAMTDMARQQKDNN